MPVLHHGFTLERLQGMNIICITQALFNFSFFGFKSLFVLYALNKYGMETPEAMELFAALMAISYATSLIGGYLADKVIGARALLLIGGCLSSLGVMLLSFESFLVIGLSLLSLGAGCIKPTFSTMLSLIFHDPQDPRKERAFTLLYISMNAGSFTGPLASGIINQWYGWNTSFLVISSIFAVGTPFFFTKTRNLATLTQNINKKDLLKLMLILLLTLSIIAFFLAYYSYFHGLMGSIVIISLISFSLIFYRSTIEERQQLAKVACYILLFAFSCSLFEQAGSSLMLFFDQAVDRKVLGFTLPSSTLLSYEPLFTLSLGIVMARYFKEHEKTKSSKNGFLKFGIGFLFISFSFGLLAFGLKIEKLPISLLWIITSIVLQTIGELFIVPIGFATVSKLSPRRYLGTMMGFWLMAISYGHYLAGFLAKFSLPSGAQAFNLENYLSFFLFLSLMALAVSILLFIVQIKNKAVSV